MKVTVRPMSESWRVSKIWPSQNWIGNFSSTEWKGGYADLLLLDEFDREITKNIKLGEDEIIYRYVSDKMVLPSIEPDAGTTGVNQQRLLMSPLIKLNLRNGRIYFLEDADNIKFSRKGVKSKWINIFSETIVTGGGVVVLRSSNW